MQPAQGRIAEPGRAAPDAELHQARAGAHQDAEGARRDLGKERTLVALADAVEFGAVVGDHPGEDIEPAGRALRVGGRRSAFAQRHIFEQRNDINAVLFENGAPRQVDAVHREEFELVAHARPRAGQKARPHPIGNLAEPQIDAGGLDLIVANRLWRQDLPALRHRLAQQLRRQQAGRQIPLAVGLSRIRRRKQLTALRHYPSTGCVASASQRAVSASTSGVSFWRTRS